MREIHAWGLGVRPIAGCLKGNLSCGKKGTYRVHTTLFVSPLPPLSSPDIPLPCSLIIGMSRREPKAEHYFDYSGVAMCSLCQPLTGLQHTWTTVSTKHPICSLFGNSQSLEVIVNSLRYFSIKNF